MSGKFSRNDLYFWVSWIGLHTILDIILVIIFRYSPFRNRISSEELLAVGILITMIILTLGQSFILRKFYLIPFTWFWATLIGYLLGGIVGSIFEGIFEISGPISSGFTGIPLGFMQWMILRGRVEKAWWWIIAVSLVVLVSVLREPSLFSGYGLLTGLILIWLMRNPIIDEENRPEPVLK